MSPRHGLRSVHPLPSLFSVCRKFTGLGFGMSGSLVRCQVPAGSAKRLRHLRKPADPALGVSHVVAKFCNCVQLCPISFNISPVSSGFSCLAKVGEPVVALWARCLHEAALTFDFVLATKCSWSRSSWTGSACQTQRSLVVMQVPNSKLLVKNKGFYSQDVQASRQGVANSRAVSRADWSPSNNLQVGWLPLRVLA